MTDYQMKCFDLIDAQQAKTTEGSTQWCVGEQLKEIAEREPEAAVILAEDLQSMTIMDAERQIKAFADKNHGKSNCFGVSPKQADKILREFFSLPAATEQATAEAAPTAPTDDFDLMAFL